MSAGRVCVLSVLALVLAGAIVAAQQEPTFRSGTHSVAVYATVLDGTGRLVPDLVKDDFEVFDDDAPQPISVFANDVRPITIVIMLDRSGSMVENFDLERSAAVQFVAHLLPADKARLGSFSNRIQIDPEGFTTDQNELIRILYEDLQDAGPTPLWNATSAAMTALAHEDDRRVVLILTDGYDNPARPTANVSFPEIRDRAEAEAIMVYGIGMSDTCGVPVAGLAGGPAALAFQSRGRGGMGRGGRMSTHGGSCSGEKPDPHLQELAAASGGGYFALQPTDDLGATFTQVANELHHQYLLGFTATTLDGKVHRLEVKVRTPGLTARARRSYVASSGR
jgi:VWFA-related protein